ncbi:aspartate 1-decarboxylase [Helicobacter sp. WB40]|uniref:Aspartate 1-decarboxylase n=2 Tax=Helicobacteraceae TaxID=72293 RepID=A0ABT4VGE0_9HELI|nr:MULTISPECIES: aspartate 1-decarboxylase [Helicobacter]MDA3967473.1 aspartate 1-decarboxylase [Helicobacter sp. WB40]MDA3969086.1 aspartate 1-decarboxylase [Helicobacter ibis]
MVRTMLYSKIHRAKVTDANLNYVGSISIDKELINAASLLEGQKVDIVNINNGERFSTYVIEGKSGEICLNGAAARKVQKDDIVIIIAYASFTEDELKTYKPKVVIVDSNNKIINIKEDLKHV